MFQQFKLVFNVCLVCIVHHPWGSWIASAPNPFVKFSLRFRVYEWNLSFALQITFLWIPPMSFSHIEIEKVRIMGSSSFRLVACSIGPPNFASAVCFGLLNELPQKVHQKEIRNKDIEENAELLCSWTSKIFKSGKLQIYHLKGSWNGFFTLAIISSFHGAILS